MHVKQISILDTTSFVVVHAGVALLKRCPLEFGHNLNVIDAH